MPAVMARFVAVPLLVVLLLVVLPVTGKVAVQVDPPEAAKTFATGQRLLREGDWLQAARTFEQLAGRYPQSKTVDLFIFYRAKAQYYFGELNEATAGFTYLLAQYPQSTKRPYIHFFLGNTYYLRGKINKALDNYLDAYRFSRSAQLDKLVEKSIVALFAHAGTIHIDKSVFDNIPPDKRCRLIEQVVPQFVQHGQVAIAKALSVSCGINLDTAQFPIPVSSPKQSLEIALVLPLSGELTSFGEEIYNGAVIAAERYRKETGKEMVLKPYDTKGDPIDAARIIGELRHTSTDAIIGPLTSEEAAVASAKLDDAPVPMIIPAATQAGLTKLSESSFQLSPNIELEGIRAAEYAVNTLGADSAVVITSTATDNLRISRAFVERFQQLGGTIVATEYYRLRDKDYGPYIRDIKALLLGAVADSIYYIDERGDTLDIDGLPVHLDCLFLPGERSQIRLLLPQIHFYNLNGTYIGSDGWADDAIYRLGDDITKNAVFPSPFMSGFHSDLYSQMASLYDARYGRSPRRLANLGFDALNIICDAYRNGAATPPDVITYLNHVAQYEGASGIVTFGENRENIEMPFYQIQNGMVTQISDTTSVLTSER